MSKYDARAEAGRFVAAIEAAHQDGQPVDPEEEVCLLAAALRRAHRDGRETGRRWALSELSRHWAVAVMSDDTEWHDAEQALRESGCHRIEVRLEPLGMVSAYARHTDGCTTVATASSISEALSALVDRAGLPAYLSMDTPEMMGLSLESEDQ